MTDPPAFGANLLLELEHVSTEAHYRDWLEALSPSCLATARVLDAFDAASCDEQRQAIVEHGTSEQLVNPQAVAGLAMLVGQDSAAA